MASLDKRESGFFSLIWTDKSRYPDPTRESLKTKSKHEAQEIKHTLEFAYKINQHNPWERKWYEDSYLREVILTKNYKEILSRKEEIKPVPLWEAAEKYIRFKIETPGEWDSQNTQKNYGWKLRKFVRFTGRDVPVSDITDTHLTRFVKRKDLSDFTIQSDIRIVNAFLEYCQGKGWRSKVETVSGPNPQKDMPDFLYPDQLKKVCLYKIDKEIEQAKYNPQWYEEYSQWWHPLFWILLARTGMRPSELIIVKLSHIHGYEIRARKGTTGKSQAAKRWVPVLGQAGRQCLDVLTDPHVRTKDTLMKESEYLFGRGSNMSKKRASREFTEAVSVMLQNKEFKLRDLRNCWAYWFLTRDRSADKTYLEYSLMRIMGHSTDKMSKHYMNSLPYNPDVERLQQW